MGRKFIIDVMPITDAKISAMRNLISALGPMSSCTGFEELIQMESIRAVTRLWWSGPDLAAFAYMDKNKTLFFEINPSMISNDLANEIITWGVACSGEAADQSVNSCVRSTNADRIRLLESNGFERQSTLSLNYSRSLSDPIPASSLPAGFTCRAVRGESEALQMVELQRAAFETDYMTLETRLAQMRAPGYCPALDLVVTAPDGRLAAFCFCTLERAGMQKTGFTEPIGTHPDFRNRSLAKALLATTLHKLNEMGCQSTRLSTSMENIAMQHLAASLDFIPDNDLVWYSK